MTPAPKDAPSSAKATEGKPVEPDFVRIAQDAGCLPMQFGTFMRYTLQQHEVRLMRAAFAAGRHLSCEALAKQEAAPQPEGREDEHG